MSKSIMQESRLQKPLFHFFLIMAICLTVYSNTLKAPFEFDDYPAIVNNPIVKDLGFMVNPSEAKNHKEIFQYDLFKRRYVGYLTFALNYRIHKLDVIGYHLVNLAIHIINALIVYCLVTLTFRTPFLNSSILKAHSNHIALFASLFFACHPVQTQAVNYIWQRVTLLSTMFYCLSLVMYIKWRLTSNKTNSFFSRIRLLFYFSSVISAVIAMKTKEFAFTLPIIILLYELMFFDGKLKKRFFYLVPLLLTMVIIPASLLDINKPMGELIGDFSETTRGDISISRWDYLFTQFTVIVTYIRLLFLPINQNLDYDYPIYNTFLTPEVFLSFLLLFSIFGLGVYMFLHSRNRNNSFRLIAFGIFWFYITLSMESSFIPLINLIFEHRIYLPSVGFSIALVLGVFLLLNKFGERKLHTIGVIIFMSVIIVLSVFSYSRNRVWSSEIALWKDCVEKSPQKVRPHIGLSNALNKQGRTEEAIEHYLKALRIKPDYVEAYIDLGAALEKTGRTDEAIAHYLKALHMKPDNVDAHIKLGNTLKNQGRFKEAIVHYSEAVRIKPDHEKAHNNLGVALIHTGNIEEAIAHFQEALRIKPDYVYAKKNLKKIQQ